MIPHFDVREIIANHTSQLRIGNKVRVPPVTRENMTETKFTIHKEK